jgi:recombination protein RecT
MDMVIQGLSMTKNQCYPIAYGDQLTLQRSYFGTQAVTKRILQCRDIFAEVVYEGDEFEYAIENGNKRVTKHTQKLSNVKAEKILAAYCTIVMSDGRQASAIMTIDEIRAAWAKSKMDPNSANSTHKQFPQEMAKKTVVGRACKPFINSSDDSSLDLLVESYHRSAEAVEEAELEEEVAAKGNGQVLDAPFVVKDEESAPVADQKTTEEPAPKEDKAQAPTQPKQEQKPPAQPKRDRGF